MVPNAIMLSVAAFAITTKFFSSEKPTRFAVLFKNASSFERTFNVGKSFFELKPSATATPPPLQ
jgi:hypothetical protein